MLAGDRSWVAAALLASALVSIVGCRAKASDAPVRGHHELCCKAANPDNVSFVGCRASDYCRAGEEVWVRGPVNCTSAEPEDCAGGRCCELAVEIAEVEVEDAVAAPLAPAPAPVVPVSLDYRAEPTATSVPTLICPATVERGVEGRVLLTVQVAADGRVSAVEIREGFEPECDALAREALLAASFEPARTPSGEAIASSTTWSYAFAADASDAAGSSSGAGGRAR